MDGLKKINTINRFALLIYLFNFETKLQANIL